MGENTDARNQGRKIFVRIAALDRNVTIYPANHPAVLDPASEVCELLEPLFAENSKVTFNIVNAEIYVERQLLREESLHHSGFIQLLMDRGMNSLSFKPGITPASIVLLFQLIHERGSDNLTTEALRTRFREQGGVGVEFEKLVALEIGKDVYEISDLKEGAHLAWTSYEGALNCLESLGNDVLAKKPIDDNRLRQVVSSLTGDFLVNRDAVMSIISIKNYDEYLFHHSVNVAVMALLIANKLSLSEDLVVLVGMSGLLHDIGKLKIPKEILGKPGKLTEEEWRIMRTHSIEGAQTLMQSEKLGEFVTLAALEHHVGYDRAGYPEIEGRDMPHVIARIISIADVYEAMTADRVYRPEPPGAHQAIKVLIDGSGTKFDPLLVKLLLNTTGVFPPGTTVRLQTGQTARVIEPTEDNPFCPKVRPFSEDGNGDPEEEIIDTSRDPSRYAVIGIAESPQV